MESQFDDELLQLKNALRQQTFRFILIGHNRYSLYKDIADWLRTTFPDRPPVELRLADKDYRHINDELLAVKKGIVLIPDFGWLFREGNESICVAFNQRRDAFARLDIALICFIEPSQYIQVPKKVPDWWSLRSLELDFYREAPDRATDFISPESESSSLGGQTREEKQAEIQRLLRQVTTTEPDNQLLLASLYSQLATLSFVLSDYEEAYTYLQKTLMIMQQIGDRQGEGRALNNISQIYRARGDNEQALQYLQQSLAIQQEIGDRRGEGATLNNISQIYRARGDNEQALQYLQQSLAIRQEIGDRRGEGTSLNNISQIYRARGDNEQALQYLQQSLAIQQEIGDRQGEGATLNNMGAIYFNVDQNIDKAFPLLLRAFNIFVEIGSPNAEITRGYLDRTQEQIGEEKFNQIVQSIQNNSENSVD
ncbi:tetratricopeptide repeat protein [Spirosoma pollinicola]|uniref:Uncharacterized protein n=1 Tax=Spirosoma pollinicola TaxID=2057025 RepID=A0A2K8Z1I3_9BACT|nr:tetratricopeptide repeat protein [Spirosoma pollinicola]AUD03699.1 hypothetical protein CWM47_18805 [Spirosoma pollinicola]